MVVMSVWRYGCYVGFWYIYFSLIVKIVWPLVQFLFGFLEAVLHKTIDKVRSLRGGEENAVRSERRRHSSHAFWIFSGTGDKFVAAPVDCSIPLRLPAKHR